VDVKSNPDDSPGVTFSLQMPIYRKTSLRVSPGKKCSLKSASTGDESFINEPKFSFSDSDDDDDLTADDVIITTSTLSDLHMDINDSLDEKMFLHALVSDKEKRLARQHSLPTPSLKLETSDDISPEVKVLKQSQHKGGQRRGAVELGPLYGCRVLLVDDSKLILRVTAATLKSLGVECDAVLDGEKALEKIKSCCWRSGEPSSNSEVENVVELDSSQWSLESRQRTTRTRSGSLGETCTQSSSWDINYYDLVMLDKQMPVMDGLKTCENLRSMGYKGIIVGVTGSCMPSEV
jgi:CheY-like chemotaxis protein